MTQKPRGLSSAQPRPGSSGRSSAQRQQQEQAAAAAAAAEQQAADGGAAAHDAAVAEARAAVDDAHAQAAAASAHVAEAIMADAAERDRHTQAAAARRGCSQSWWSTHVGGMKGVGYMYMFACPGVVRGDRCALAVRIATYMFVCMRDRMTLACDGCVSLVS